MEGGALSRPVVSATTERGLAFPSERVENKFTVLERVRWRRLISKLQSDLKIFVSGGDLHRGSWAGQYPLWRGCGLFRPG